jgi:nitroreductase/NAD-dependent dihydropyrimidine dehydrogenase PreA subunit
MPIKTSRTNENAKILIDADRCTACGLCVQICKDLSLEIKDGKLRITEKPLFGCMACGHCAAVCPNQAITIEGRAFSPADVLELPPVEMRANYDQLLSLLQSRRSVRDFKDQTVESEVIEKIIRAAATAPMGIPPSDVGLLVLNGKEKVREFSWDFFDFAKTRKWFFSPAMLMIFRLMMGKEAYEFFKSFAAPLFDFLIERKEKGEDWLLYGAPLAIYFSGSPYADPADTTIAATYAMLAAESLGLGSCMIGSIAPLLRYAPKLKQKYGIPLKSRDGMMVIFGYPKYKFRRSLRRTFREVQYY